tara:strand:- start:199 stop:579 length:381 start_codon:yes stop_codon:yes gene_type:complete
MARNWKFSRIDYKNFSKFDLPKINTKVALYTVDGIFDATVKNVYCSHLSKLFEDYISFSFIKDGVVTTQDMPLDIVMQVGENAYATFSITSAYYISVLIDVLVEWNTESSKNNIAILEKGFGDSTS